MFTGIAGSSSCWSPARISIDDCLIDGLYVVAGVRGRGTVALNEVEVDQVFVRINGPRDAGGAVPPE